MDDPHHDVERPHCRVEIETFPSRVFVRLHFANGNGDLRAGVLTLEPKIWLALLAGLEGWCEVVVEVARDTMVWQPSVVEELLVGDDEVEPVVVGVDPVPPAPEPDPVEPVEDDDDIVAIDPPDDFTIEPDSDTSDPLGDHFDEIFNIEPINEEEEIDDQRTD